jgi:hypothetical protein
MHDVLWVSQMGMWRCSRSWTRTTTHCAWITIVLSETDIGGGSWSMNLCNKMLVSSIPVSIDNGATDHYLFPLPLALSESPVSFYILYSNIPSLFSAPPSPTYYPTIRRSIPPHQYRVEVVLISVNRGGRLLPWVVSITHATFLTDNWLSDHPHLHLPRLSMFFLFWRDLSCYFTVFLNILFGYISYMISLPIPVNICYDTNLIFSDTSDEYASRRTGGFQPIIWAVTCDDNTGVRVDNVKRAMAEHVHIITRFVWTFQAIL